MPSRTFFLADRNLRTGLGANTLRYGGDGAAIQLSIVTPVFNESESIRLLYRQIVEHTRAITDNLEIIFVDDGSTDQSIDLIRSLCEVDGQVKLISFSRNFGHQVALTAGIDYASGDAVILMDSDLQHPAKLIPDLVARWQEGFDIVYTIREATEDAGWFKQATARLFYRLFRKLTKMDLPAGAADFRLLDRRVVIALRRLRERARFLRGLTNWVGYRSVGVPYNANARAAGSSKYNVKRMLGLAVDGLVSFTPAPLYVSIYLGFLVAGLGFLYGLYALSMKVFTDAVLPGWTSLVIFVSFIGGMQLLSIGLVGVYLAKTYEEVKQRPLYLVREVVGFPNVAHFQGPEVCP